MRKLFFIMWMFCVLIACDDDTKENDSKSPIKNLEFPSEDVFKAGKEVTIQGEGFTTSDKIFLTPFKVKSEASARISITKIQVTANSLSFVIPVHITGSYEVILSQNAKEYVLGILKIEKKENEFYAFCYDSDINELARLDLENEKLIWTGIKIPEYEGNGCGQVIDKVNNEFIAFTPYPATIYRVNMDTKVLKTVILEKGQRGKSFEDIIQTSDNEYYAFCYSSDVCELAKLDIENEKLVWTGVKIPEYGGNGCGQVIDEVNNEFIAFTPYPATIHKVNMETKVLKTIILEKNRENRNFENIIKTSDNEYYAFCYDEDVCELAKLDIENEKIVWTGIKIPGYNGNGRGQVIDEVNNEFIAFTPYPATIYRVNMDTKVLKTVILEKGDKGRNFENIILK